MTYACRSCQSRDLDAEWGWLEWAVQPLDTRSLLSVRCRTCGWIRWVAR